MANEDFSQDPFEERKEPFEEWKADEEALGQDAPKNSLERKSLLGGPDKKKNVGMLILFGLLLAVGAFLIFSNDKKQDSEGIVQEAEEFTPAPRRAVAIPEAPPLPPPPVQQPPSEDELRKAEEAEALRQARLKSAIVVYQGGASPATPQASPSEGEALSPPGSSKPTSSDPNRQFQEANTGGAFPKAQASALGNMGNIILQGKLIDAVLETGVNSDLPGMVRALVSYDVYGEAGNKVLIPRGSRLIGQYNSAIRKGQARVFVIWNRLIRPDGIEVALDSGGTDPLGVAGLKGRVNNHFFQIFGTSFLLSILGAATATAGVDTSDQYNSLAAYRQEVANGFRDTASGVLEQYASIPPTITIKQGSLIKVFVARDLDFSEALMALYPAHKMIVVP